MNETGDGPGKNDIVFGIRKYKEMLDQSPCTKKYCAIVYNFFETYSNVDKNEKIRLLDALVAQPLNDWRPHARFFKYEKKSGKIRPIDDKQAKEETRALMRGMKQMHERQSASPQKGTTLEKAPTMSASPTCENYVVFGIGNDAKLLQKYARTTEYRKLLKGNLEAHRNANLSERNFIVAKMVSHAYGWKPQVEFFKFDRASGKLSPLNDKEALIETRRCFTKMRKLPQRKVGTSAGMEDEDSETSTTQDVAEWDDEGDTGASVHKTVDSPSNSNSTDSKNGCEVPHDKKRAFTKLFSEGDDLEREMKEWDPSSLRFKLRKKFLDRTTYVEL